jgi:hypothetical protein
VADVRTALYRRLAREGKTPGHVCHPYDVCATLIGREAGLAITDIAGRDLDTPLDLLASVDWIGYANEYIRAEVEPVLQALLRKYGLTE